MHHRREYVTREKAAVVPVHGEIKGWNASIDRENHANIKLTRSVNDGVNSCGINRYDLSPAKLEALCLLEWLQAIGA